MYSYQEEPFYIKRRKWAFSKKRQCFSTE